MGLEVDARTSLVDDGGEAHAYYAQLHPAGKGFRLLVKLVRLAGGALGRAWGAFSPAEVGEKLTEITSMLDQGIDGEAIASAFERLATQILDEGADDFVRAILEFTNRDGSSLGGGSAFDNAFRGNYGELFSAIVWTLKINYGPFFVRRLGGFTGGLGSLLGKLREARPLTSSERPESSV